MSAIHLSQELSQLQGMTRSVTVLIELVAASKDLTDRLHSLWRAAKSMRAELGLVLRDVRKVRESVAIDPEDILLDTLLSCQEEMRQSVRTIRDAILPGLRSLHFFAQMFFAWRLMLNLVKAHGVIGEIRTEIMEHDADCSPRLGRYTNAAELIKALDDAA